MPDRLDLVRELRRLVEQIPRGRVSTVSDLARGLGDESAAPAVVRILRDLSFAGTHRVVQANGAVHDPHSATLLRAEEVPLARGRVVRLKDRRTREFQGPQPLEKLRDEQKRLAARVVKTDGSLSWDTIAGFDLAYDGNLATAAATVYSLAADDFVQNVWTRVRVRFPYIPGYLATREFPGIKRCFALLNPKPDVLMIDGHGVLHPARFGLASCVGVSLNRPTIGVAKRLHVGEIGPIPREVGGTAPIRLDDELCGVGLRSSQSRRLIYVSVGHLISLKSAVRLTKLVCKTRIPEPLRLAHLLAKEKQRK